jgi:tRNA A-37 threonylcarbamoyl transferase component Bud32
VISSQGRYIVALSCVMHVADVFSVPLGHSNIIISDDGQPILMDFGSAKK